MVIKRLTLFACGAVMPILVSLHLANAADWATHDPNQTGYMDHSYWDRLLEAVALAYDDMGDDASRSKWDCRTTTSRIPSCDADARSSRNMRGVTLVPYEYLPTDYLLHFDRYIRALSKIEVDKLNKDDQLAYWLNLHNALVVRELWKNYPMRSVYDLRDRPRQRQSREVLWNQPLVTVLGERLSLHQIEQDILFEHWSEDYILYGVFDGSVGSPSLMRDAFTGQKVHQQLQSNARRFVNSPRVMRVRGDRARVSTAYAWAHKLFDGPADILEHIKSLASDPLRERLERVRRVQATFYEYDLAEYTRPKDSAHGFAAIVNFQTYFPPESPL